MRTKQPIELGVSWGTETSRTLNGAIMARIAGQLGKPLIQRLVEEIRSGNASAFSLTTDSLTFTCPPAVGAIKVQV